MPDIFIEPKKEIHTHPKFHSMNPFVALADHPNGVHFSTQGPQEVIEMFLRKHFITNVPWLITSIILFLIPPIFFPFIFPLMPFTISTQLVTIIIFFWYLSVFGSVVLASFINWYFNVYIVTNERVIDVDFINLLYREISATRLNLVQDVTVKSAGVIRSVFHYGDIFIQTAGTEINFDFLAVPRPEFVAHRIEELMRGSRKKEGKSSLEEDMER